MYISLFTICILAAIVIFCWFRKPAKTAANAASEVIEMSADILHSGLSQLRDQVETATIVSSVKNTLEVTAFLAEHKDIVAKGVTVHSLYRGYQATIEKTTTGDKGKALTPQQENALLRASFMEALNSLSAPAPAPEAQSQPTVQATQPTQADADAEVFKL